MEDNSEEIGDAMKNPSEQPDEEVVPQAALDTKALQTIEHHAHPTVNWAKFVTIYAPPKQRMRWGDKLVLPHVNWGDLFFDLFYVAAAFNLSHILVDDTTGLGLLYFLGAMLPVVVMWIERHSYLARFTTSGDFCHLLFEFGHWCVVATVVVHIRPVEILADSESRLDMFALALALLLDNVLVAAKFAEVWLNVDGGPEARSTGKAGVRLLIPGFGLYLAATIVAGIKHYGTAVDTDAEDHPLTAEFDEYNVPIILCLVGALTTMAFMVVELLCFVPKDEGKLREVAVPMNIEYSIHRQGEWIMLMLGESILGLITVDVSESNKYYWTFYAGILSVILLEYNHYHSQPENPEDHAMSQSAIRAVSYCVLFVVYSAALVLVGTSYKLFVSEFTYEVEEEDEEGDERLLSIVTGGVHRFLPHLSTERDGDPENKQQQVAYLFSGSLATVLFANEVIVWACRGLKANFQRQVCNNLRISMEVLKVGIIAFIATLATWQKQPMNLALIGFGAILLWAILRIVGNFLYEATRQVHEEHAEEANVSLSENVELLEKEEVPENEEFSSGNPAPVQEEKNMEMDMPAAEFVSSSVVRRRVEDMMTSWTGTLKESEEKGKK